MAQRISTRLNKQSLVPFGIEDMSVLIVSVGPETPCPNLRLGHARSVILESPASSKPGFLLTLPLSWRPLSFLAERAMSAIGAYRQPDRTSVCPLLDQSGQSWFLVRGGLSANDPKRTLKPKEIYLVC